MEKSLKDYIESLPDDLKDKAKKATSLEELKEILGSSMCELTEEELSAVAGGGAWDFDVDDYGWGDVREEFDSSKIPVSFLSGEDLGF